MKEAEIENVLKPVSNTEQSEREAQVRRDFWPKFRRFAAQLPFAEEVAAAYFCAIDARTPFRVKATLFAALAYFILPFDVIPDFLLMVGMGDDIAVLSAAFALVRQHINEDHREKARAALEEAIVEEVSVVE